MNDEDTADEILRTIRKIVRRISEHSRYLGQHVGLTVPQLACLKAIAELDEAAPGQVTVVQVAERVQLSPATVSRIVDRLVRSELVLRDRSTEDRRKVSLSLTTVGIERYQTLPMPLQQSFVARLEKLPTKKRLALLQSLRQIADLMDASDLDAAPLLTPGPEPEPPRS